LLRYGQKAIIIAAEIKNFQYYLHSACIQHPKNSLFA
jgi:hypothetical protein